MSKRYEDQEVRAIAFELRLTEEGKLAGFAALYGVEAQIGSFIEQIASGAFSKTLKESDIRALFNHDPNFVIGRTSNGTLVLEERKEGLWMEVTPPNTQWARDLMESIRRGDISGQSFSFQVVKEEWADGKPPRRTLQEVHLHDVGPVTFPAYEATSVSVRAKEIAEGKADPAHDQSADDSDPAHDQSDVEPPASEPTELPAEDVQILTPSAVTKDLRIHAERFRQLQTRARAAGQPMPLDSEEETDNDHG